MLWVLLATVGIVFVIACANVANLLLLRADARRREFAVRAALGAGRRRILRGLLVESLLVGVTSGLLGLTIAEGGLHVLSAINPPNLPRLAEIAINARVLVFTAALAVASSVIFALVPGFRYGTRDVAAILRTGGRTASDGRERRRLRDVLVVTQVALAFVLVICSGLMVRTMGALGTVDPGFRDGAHLETVRIRVPEATVPEAQAVSDAQHRLVDAIQSIAGVDSVAFATTVPMDGQPPDWDDVAAEGRTYRPGEIPAFRRFDAVSPGYFRTTGTRLLAGREYDWNDFAAARPFAIVSANLAREMWGSPAAAIGKRIRALDRMPWREIIGVTEDTRENGVDQPAPSTVYWPTYGQSLYAPGQLVVERSVTFTVRSDRAGTDGLMSDLRRAVWSVNPNLPLAGVRTLRAIYEQSIIRTSFAMRMLTAAAGVGLLFGIVGIYGIVSYAVSQRTREIGIRLALGADGRRITSLFLQQALVLSGAGVLIGVMVAAGVARWMVSLLFGTPLLDAPTWIVASTLLMIAAGLAGYLPARRAALVDPVTALKVD
jgi:predicted permease